MTASDMEKRACAIRENNIVLFQYSSETIFKKKKINKFQLSTYYMLLDTRLNIEIILMSKKSINLKQLLLYTTYYIHIYIQNVI